MTAVLARPAKAATRFVLPAGSEATAPPEYAGHGRDDIALLLARSGGISEHRFGDLPDLLAPGDLLVVNTSPTLPAALDARLPDGTTVPIHVSAPLEDDSWVIEIRRADNSGPERGLAGGSRIELPGAVALTLTASYPLVGLDRPRLWQATVSPATELSSYLHRHGRPIRYSYVPGELPIEDYQTVYAAPSADGAGSAEMASAGRPLTTGLLTRLMARGITVAPLQLHAGVASPEAHEPPMPERFAVPAATARLVELTRRTGGRVVAVGTTVVRALETVARPDGTVPAATGWTELVIGPHRPIRVVDGLLTGLHEPEASHLLMLEQIAGPELVGAAYEAAVDRGLRWHEFGDSMLFLP